jgi:hypothetical protein
LEIDSVARRRYQFRERVTSSAGLSLMCCKTCCSSLLAHCPLPAASRYHAHLRGRSRLNVYTSNLTPIHGCGCGSILKVYRSSSTPIHMPAAFRILFLMPAVKEVRQKARSVKSSGRALSGASSLGMANTARSHPSTINKHFQYVLEPQDCQYFTM